MRRTISPGAILLILCATASWGQEGVVVMVRPEGIVVDVSMLGQLQRGSRLEFVRPASGRSLTGHGIVTDVHAAQVLVAASQGSWVREGDVAVTCPPDLQGYHELRLTVQQLQGASLAPHVRELADRLERALNTRDAIVRQGRCDTLVTDHEIARLTQELQTAANAGSRASQTSGGQATAGSFPTASPGWPPTGGLSSPTAGPSPDQPASRQYPPGQPPQGQSPSWPPGGGQPASGQYPPGPYSQSPGPPPPGPGSFPQSPTPYPSQVPQDPGGPGRYPPGQGPYSPGPSSPGQGPLGPGPTVQNPPATIPLPESAPGGGGDAIDRAGRVVDVLAKMAGLAQGLGLGANRRGAQGPSPSSGSGYPPPAGHPPQGGAYPPVGVGWGTSPTGTPSEGGFPGQGSQGGGAPSPGGYPPGGDPSGGSTAGQPGYPPTPSSGASTAPSGTGSPGGGGTPAPGPEGGMTGGGQGGSPLWGALGKGLRGSAPGPSAGAGSAGAPKTPAVVLLAKRATVTGQVLSESGQAIAAAVVKVSVDVAGSQVKTEARTDGKGAFTLAYLPSGAFVMTVSAPGHLNGTHTGNLDPGRTERINIKLRRLGVMP